MEAKGVDALQGAFVSLEHQSRVLPRYVVLPVTPSHIVHLIVDSFFYVNIYHIWSQTNIYVRTHHVTTPAF